MIPDSGGLSALLGDFAEVCAADGRRAVLLAEENGERCFKAGSYCGFICFTDGTFVEILPYPGGAGIRQYLDKGTVSEADTAVSRRRRSAEKALRRVLQTVRSRAQPVRL